VIFCQIRTLAELLANDLDDVVGVANVASEYQGLGNLGAPGKISVKACPGIRG